MRCGICQPSLSSPFSPKLLDCDQWACLGSRTVRAEVSLPGRASEKLARSARGSTLSLPREVEGWSFSLAHFMLSSRWGYGVCKSNLLSSFSLRLLGCGDPSKFHDPQD